MVIAVVVLVVVVGSDRLRVNPRPDRENSVPRRACSLLYIDYRYIDILNTKHIDKKRDTCIHRYAWCFIARATMRARSHYIFLVAFGRERKKMLACDFSYQVVKSSSITVIKSWYSYYT